MPSLDRDGNVFVLNLGDGENRFNPDWIGGVNDALDVVEAGSHPRALVLTAEGKIWSNGLDLEWFAGNVPQVPEFVVTVHEFLARVLKLGVPTISAIQGHCFAAGAMLALATDERVMREDRGFFCLPEIDLRIPFTPGMDALIKARLTPQVAHEAMTTGKRYGGVDAFEAAIVQLAVPEGEVLSVAIERANEFADHDTATLGTIKERLYAPALETLRDPVANGIPGLEDN